MNVERIEEIGGSTGHDGSDIEVAYAFYESGPDAAVTVEYASGSTYASEDHARGVVEAWDGEIPRWILVDREGNAEARD